MHIKCHLLLKVLLHILATIIILTNLSIENNCGMLTNLSIENNSVDPDQKDVIGASRAMIS